MCIVQLYEDAEDGGFEVYVPATSKNSIDETIAAALVPDKVRGAAAEMLSVLETIYSDLTHPSNPEPMRTGPTACLLQRTILSAGGTLAKHEVPDDASLPAS